MPYETTDISIAPLYFEFNTFTEVAVGDYIEVGTNVFVVREVTEHKPTISDRTIYRVKSRSTDPGMGTNAKQIKSL